MLRIERHFIKLFLAFAAIHAGASEPIKAIESAPKPPLDGKKILFVVPARNFRDEELFDTRKNLTDAGAQSWVASTVGDSITGMLLAKVKPDGLLGDAKIANFDAVIFVGGSGATALWDNKDAHKLAQEAQKQNKVIGAICLAPVILARAGVLRNCSAAVFESAKGELEKAGVKYVQKEVAVCGNIITANGPGAVQKFAVEIKNALTKQQAKPANIQK